jgi:hypothetical protein
MISYKDKSFCMSDCTNTGCHRNFTPSVKAAAIAWWGKDDPPVAFMDFSDTCPDYRKPNP